MPYERYHIPTTPAPPLHEVIGKFRIVRDTNICRNCGRCIKACVYGVHERKGDDERRMEEPLSHLCRNCFRCVQICPVHALSMTMNPEYSSLGDQYWEPHRFYTISYEAEHGRIPVFGAGYRGPFAGRWFDGMWTDMSEIVRPTRDGIHGREYISTAIDIGRKHPFLEFDNDGRLRTKPAPAVEIQIPIIFDVLPREVMSEHIITILSKAAAWLGTLCIVPVEESACIPKEEREHVIPLVQERIREEDAEILRQANIIEIARTESFELLLKEVRAINRNALISARMPLVPEITDEVIQLCDSKIEIAHIVADSWGLERREYDQKHLRDALKDLHLGLVERAMRDEISIFVSGGIAAAEHLPKAMILGADVVCIDRVVMIALECRLCQSCTAPQLCPVDINQVNKSWAVQRIVNVIGAWRDQLLEVMGAMGLRDARRLRGELGRAMFVEELEREVFVPIFERGEL